MFPYLTLAKWGSALALLIAVFFYGHHIGAQSVQSAWDHSKFEEQQSTIGLVVDRAKAIADTITDNNIKNVEVSNAHQQQVDKLDKDLADARATIKRNGGLQYRDSEANTATGDSKASGNSGYDADTTGTRTLPESITEQLLNNAAEADRVTEVARACQNWVVTHGFYSNNKKEEAPVKETPSGN